MQDVTTKFEDKKSQNTTTNHWSPRLPVPTVLAGSSLLTAYELALFHQAAGFFETSFAFFASIVAIIALGFGACLAGIGRPTDTNRTGSFSLAAAGLTSAAAVFLSALVPLDFPAALLVLISLQALPFVLWGRSLGLLFRDRIAQAGLLFAATMAGNALGYCIGFVMLEYCGGPLPVILLLSASFALTGLILCRSRTMLVFACLTAIVLGIGGSLTGLDKAPIPVWHSDTGTLGNLLSTMVYHSGQVERKNSTWGAAGRTDLVGVRQGEENIRWLFRNGSLHSIMPGRSNIKDVEWLQPPFPLPVLTLRAVQPRKLLILNPGGGLELRLASDFGTPEISTIEADSSMRDIWEASTEFHGNLPHRHGINFRYGEARLLLGQNSQQYDLIQLNLRENNQLYWAGWGIKQDFLSTAEAFQTYWTHLSPDGVLALSTTNEPNFARALCMIRETISQAPAQTKSSPGERIWAFQTLPSSANNSNGYNFLLLATKGEPSQVLRTRLNEATKNDDIQPLLGPGIVSSAPYSFLVNSGDQQVGRARLAMALSQKYRLPIDLSTATDANPFFIRPVSMARPFTKYGFGIVLGLIIACLVLPLPALRPLDAPGTTQRLPIPIFLGFFIFLGAGIIMAQAFLTYCALHILVPAHIAVPLTLACFLVGLALGSGLSERIPDHKHAAWLTRAPLAAIPLLLLVGWALFFSNDHIAGFGMVSRGLAIGSAGLFLGTSLGPILPLGLKTLARQIPDLTTWAYASYYLALAAGAFAMQWLARFYGWNTVGNTAGLCFALVCCTGIFLWPPWTRRKKPEESPLN